MNLRYAQLAGPVLRRSPWRALAAWSVLVTGLVGTVFAVMLVLAPTGLIEAFLSAPDDYTAFSPVLMATTLLLIPIFYFVPTAVTARCVLGMSPRRVCSVTGRFRWGFYGRCLAVSAVTVLAVWAAALPWTGLPVPVSTPRWPLLLVVLGGVPLAAFAEEFAFRGVLTHLIGAWWARGLWAAGVSAVTSSVLFAVVHGAFEPVLFLTFVIGGVAYSVLCDRTGGLEASTAAHTVFNLAAFTSALHLLPTSAWPSGFAGLVPVLVSEAVLVVALVVLARRDGVEMTISDGFADGSQDATASRWGSAQTYRNAAGDPVSRLAIPPGGSIRRRPTQVPPRAS